MAPLMEKKRWIIARKIKFSKTTMSTFVSTRLSVKTKTRGSKCKEIGNVESLERC